MNSYQIKMSLRLIQLRREWKYTKKDVCIRCGIKYKRYKQLEAGEDLPKADEIASLCKLYHREPNWFVSFDF